MLGCGLPGRLTLQRNQRLSGDVWRRGAPPYGPERPEVAGSSPAAVANTSLRLDAVQLGMPIQTCRGRIQGGAFKENQDSSCPLWLTTADTNDLDWPFGLPHLRMRRLAAEAVSACRKGADRPGPVQSQPRPSGPD